MIARIACILFTVFASFGFAETLTLPLDQRPEWLARDGIVMAGSWEPLLFRVRRDGSVGYAPTAEQRAAYAREHSPEMIARLKALGVNFVMMHCYKGAGPQAERESMADAVRFARLCREAGLRVGVYNYSGAFLWEPLFEELPQARDWVLLDPDRKPRTYGSATYRYRWDRNHPDAQAFYRKIVRFAVEEIRADLLHFDNYAYGPGREENNVQRFRQYLRDTFGPERLKEIGVADLNGVQPAVTGPPDNALRRAWLDFACRSLADSYHDMSRYARGLRPDILIECNPGGVGDRIRPPVHHGALLQGGEAFWDEGRPPGFRDGKLSSRIRTYKVARRTDNIAFTYCTNPLEMAESMAFNRDCLGCICWFEYGRLAARPGSEEPVSNALKPFIHFFRTRRDLLRDARVVADVAVLRSFASQVFADPRHAGLTAAVEQALIENRVPFQIIYDPHLRDLNRYRVLVLAGCVALSDEQIDLIRQYARSGGRLCVVGPAATHDESMVPRRTPGLNTVEPARLIRIPEDGDVIDGVRRACDHRLGLTVQAPAGLCAELTEQAGRRLVHLVNYRSDVPAAGVKVDVRLPPGRHATGVLLASPERASDRKLEFHEADGVVNFTVPEVRTYEIAIVAHEAGPREGDRFTVLPVNNPRFCNNELFRAFEDYRSPRVRQLRERYGLDAVVAGESDEWKRILLLRHWIKSKIAIDNENPTQTRGDTFAILDAALRGGRFHCTHFSIVQHAVLNSYGYVTRRLGCGPGLKDDGGHHGVNEVWVNKFSKWVLIDAKYDAHYEKEHVPLSALEIRDEVWRDGARSVVCVVGPERRPMQPDPATGQSETRPDTYRWCSWETSTNRFTAFPMRLTSTLVMLDDEIFRKNRWYRDGKPHWAYGTPYLIATTRRDWIEWTPNVITSRVTIGDEKVQVFLASCTPNFKTYQMKVGDGPWADCDEQVTLPIAASGRNRFTFRTVNLFGVTGPEHRVEIAPSPRPRQDP